MNDFHNNYEYGQWAENLVESKYKEKGFRTIAKNFQYYRQGSQGRLGEIDLIMVKEKLLILVEVKARSTNNYGGVEGQVTKNKLRCLYKTFNYFNKKHPEFKGYDVRFDVALIQGKTLNIIPNAYSFEWVVS